MKKVTIIILVAIILAFNARGQVTKVPPCDCTVPIKKADTICAQPKEIYLKFDSCSQRITGQSQDWLKSNKDYIFVIKPINSALYSTKTSANNINRTASLPPVLSAFSPFNTTATPLLNAMILVKRSPPSAFAGKPEFDQYFLDRFDYDYKALRIITNQIRDLVNDIASNNTQTFPGNLEACRKLKAIKDTLTKYQYHVSPNTKETEDFALVKDKNLCDQKVFKAVVSLTYADYLNRVKIINLSSRTVGSQFDDDELTIINRTADLVRKDSSFITQSGDILFTILNATPHIDSKPYRILGDYLQVDIALLKPKFGDKPDTVSINKLNFYKVGYWKWLDVSTGFFYDNLASKSFYFNNGSTQAEIKSKADISVGALVHSYWVFDSWFKAGPCAGVSVSLLDGKSKYLVGGSLIFGRNNEWAFSGGYALASLPLASNLYKQGSYNQTTTTITTGGATPGTTISQVTTTPVGVSGTVNTYNKLQGGFFVGISYSLLKL